MRYAPAAWLPNRHLMTIYANLARLPTRLPVERERWELPDGDFLDVDRLAAPHADAPRVLVLHGLEGSSRAGYVQGLMRQLRARGVGTVALNFRGCSGEPNRLLRQYHSGETGDLSYAVDKLIAQAPGRPLALAGFSLGGNVVTKLLAERGDGLPRELRGAAVVSVPFDLRACADALDGPGAAAFIYRERFLRKLRPKALAKARRFAGALDEARIRSARTLFAFDDAATAPMHGFAGAADYYARSSAAQLVHAVRRPLLVVVATDDPFVPEHSLPLAAARENPAVTLDLSAAGGHVAFVEGPPWAPRRYAEARAADFLAELVC